MPASNSFGMLPTFQIQCGRSWLHSHIYCKEMAKARKHGRTDLGQGGRRDEASPVQAFMSEDLKR